MPEPKTKRLTGTLIRIRDEGYAFIHVRDMGDYYVNVSSMRRREDWQEQAEVSFMPGEPRANKATPAYDVVAIKKSAK